VFPEQNSERNQFHKQNQFHKEKNQYKSLKKRRIMMSQVSRKKTIMQQVLPTKNPQASSFKNKISFTTRKIKVKI